MTGPVRRGIAACAAGAVLGFTTGAASAQGEGLVAGCYGPSGGRGVRVSAAGEVYRWTQPRTAEPPRQESLLGSDPARAAEISAQFDALAPPRRGSARDDEICFVQRGSQRIAWPRSGAPANPRARELLARLETLASVTARAAEAESGAIRSGCGGGVTGAYSGVVFAADGGVSRWQSGAEEGILLGRDLAGARGAIAELERMRFAGIEHQERSNMTCFLRHRGHEVSWPSDSSDAPAAVVALFERIEAIAVRAEAARPRAPAP